jgi:hypothetical protein
MFNVGGSRLHKQAFLKCNWAVKNAFPQHQQGTSELECVFDHDLSGSSSHQRTKSQIMDDRIGEHINKLEQDTGNKDKHCQEQPRTT